MSQRSSLLAALWVTAVLLAAPDNDCWFDWGTAVTTDRTSLIVDPPDGSIPPLTPAAPRLRAARAEARSEVGTDEPPPGGWTSGRPCGASWDSTRDHS